MDEVSARVVSKGIDEVLTEIVDRVAIELVVVDTVTPRCQQQVGDWKFVGISLLD